MNDRTCRQINGNDEPAELLASGVTGTTDVPSRRERELHLHESL